jgi:hypothetical protein
VSAPVPSIRIPGVIRKSGESQLQIDNFKWHLPLIYTHCLETFWRRFMRFNTLHHIHKMLQNCWRKSFLNTQNPRASGGGFATAGDLKRSPDPSPTFVPLTQNPGSAPVKDAKIYAFFNEKCLYNLYKKIAIVHVQQKTI